MTARTYVAVLLVVAALAATPGTAPAGTSGAHNCGTVSAGGRSWALASTGINCAAARGILRTIVAKAPASGFHRLSGTYAQMKCNSIVGGGKHAFQCSSRDGRTTLTALAR